MAPATTCSAPSASGSYPRAGKAIGSRLGGDEFTMLLPGSGPEDAERIRARLREAIQGADPVGTELLCITPSIGVA